MRTQRGVIGLAAVASTATLLLACSAALAAPATNALFPIGDWPPTAPLLDRPNAAAAIADWRGHGPGTIVADSALRQVLFIGWNGDVATVAGDGAPCEGPELPCGDGGPGPEAHLTLPIDVDVTSAGDVLVSDLGTKRLRVIDHTHGAVRTLLATAGSEAAGGANWEPWGVVALPAGGALVADSLAGRILRIDSAGAVRVVAGTGDALPSTAPQSATQVQLDLPTGVALTSDGGFAIADSGANRILRVGANGLLRSVAGTGTSGFGGDGLDADLALLAEPTDVTEAPDGSLVIADTGNNRIRRVSATGRIATVAGTDGTGLDRAGPALLTRLDRPMGVTAMDDGAVLVVDTGRRMVHVLDAGLTTRRR